ncbi:hypothetical protein BT69DRAFT_394674 [Atractiella rhizophila]|nr:hypothetical protein BT69DRAFT_394674 [Atractiella rhizophila]
MNSAKEQLLGILKGYRVTVASRLTYSQKQLNWKPRTKAYYPNSAVFKQNASNIPDRIVHVAALPQLLINRFERYVDQHLNQNLSDEQLTYLKRNIEDWERRRNRLLLTEDSTVGQAFHSAFVDFVSEALFALGQDGIVYSALEAIFRDSSAWGQTGIKTDGLIRSCSKMEEGIAICEQKSPPVGDHYFPRIVNRATRARPIRVFRHTTETDSILSRMASILGFTNIDHAFLNTMKSFLVLRNLQVPGRRRPLLVTSNCLDPALSPVGELIVAVSCRIPDDFEPIDEALIAAIRAQVPQAFEDYIESYPHSG